MAQDNLICVHHCTESAGSVPDTERFLSDESGTVLGHYILFVLTPRGLLDRTILEEVMEEFHATRQGMLPPVAGARFVNGEALRLGPFSGLSQAEALALALADRVSAPLVAMLSVPEYNAVLEGITTLDGPQGHLFEALFSASRPLKHDESKSRKGLLGKIFN